MQHNTIERMFYACADVVRVALNMRVCVCMLFFVVVLPVIAEAVPQVALK